jgi:hypothetical protein
VGMVHGSPKTLKVLLYSSDRRTRDRVKQLLGVRPSAELPALEYVEVATEPVVIQQMDSGEIDLAILDGEAVPAGGMGISRQLNDEIYQCPPLLVLVARQADAWLATWSRADAVAPGPLDPLEFPELVAGLLRQRIAALPAS